MRTLLLAAAVSLSAPSVLAQVSVTDGWARATPPGARTAAAYVTLTNRGKAPDRLMSASTDAAAKLEPHHMGMAGGVMTMRRFEGGLALAPGASVRLQPGGDHLMLTGLKRPLKAGERLAATLKFERAGALRIDLPVRAAAPDAMPGMKMGGR